MNILNKLTLKHLKMNKKRTLVTIIGIILSTSLMVGIGLLFSSLMATEIDATIKNNGSYHIRLENLNLNTKKQLESNLNIKKSYSYAPLGFAKFLNETTSKSYLYVVEADNEFLDTLKLKKGRLPVNDNEILISEDMQLYSNTPYQLGSTLTLDIGARIVDNEVLDISSNYSLTSSLNDQITYNNEELQVNMTKNYTIVGIISHLVYEDYDGAGFLTITKNTTNRDIYTTFVEYKKPRKAYKITEEIVKNLDLSDSFIKYNKRLLNYYGASNYQNVENTIISLMIIGLLVVSVGCIIVIYNAFAISTMERKKSFGLYSSIGATTRQIKHTVLFEALIVGTIGIILGFLGAFLGIFTVIKILNILLKDALNGTIIFSAEPLYIIIPLIFMIIVILISAYLPAKRSSKITPITAIRGNDDIKIGKKDVKTPKFIQKLFGIEGNIAFKNIKRNKKKYRITIISLFISIVMFNTFTSFLSYVVKSTDVIDYFDYDIAVLVNGTYEETKNDMELLKSRYAITKDLTIIDTKDITVNNLTLNDFTSIYQDTYLQDTSINNLDFRLVVLQDTDYTKISSSEAILINNNYSIIYSTNKRVVKDIEIFMKNSYDLALNFEDKKININANILNKPIYGLKSNLYYPTPILIISNSTYQRKFAPGSNYASAYIMNTKEYRRIYDELKNKTVILSSKDFDINSPAINMASVKNLVLAIKILFYGFITLVTLIGVTSVINTINTNINLRKKEFAMLRSVGLTPNGFNKLLFFESMFFGLKALIYGIPVSLGINLLISIGISNMIETKMIVNWESLAISVIGVFIIVLITMNYASKKIRKENILEALREENI